MAKLPADSPRNPPKYQDADIGAIQALAKGTALPHQQQRALKFIVENICKTYDLSYRPDPYDTALAEGKRFVGLQIVKATKLNLEALTHGRRNPRSDDREQPDS